MCAMSKGIKPSTTNETKTMHTPIVETSSLLSSNMNRAYRLKARSVLKLVALVPFFVVAASAPLFAAEHDKVYKGSPEFERMKSLAGTWKGKTDMGQGPVEMTVEYRVISGGSAVEERIFEGTPREMVTIYHDKNGKLALTHYCMLANRPAMLLESSDGKTLRFDFDATCGIDAKSEM